MGMSDIEMPFMEIIIGRLYGKLTLGICQLFTSDVGIECWLRLMNKEGIFDFAMVVRCALRQNIKAIPLGVMSSGFHVSFVLYIHFQK